MKKRVLIIGYLYPDFGMGGARLRRIARLLPRHGWEPTVLTHPVDATSVDHVHEGVKVEAAGALDLTAAYAQLRDLMGRGRSSQHKACEPVALPMGLTGKINRWVMIPDKQVTWYRSAVQIGRSLLRSGHYDAVFGSLDPRTALLVTARLSRDTGIPAIVEYRDLWIGNPYYHIGQPGGIHRAVHRHLEKRVISSVSRVSTVCRGISAYLGREYASILKAPVAVNYNFFDPEEYPTANPRTPRPFTISYMGNMFSDRTPHRFFAGLRSFLDRSALRPDQFRFRWAGTVSGIDDLAALLDRTGVRPYIDFLGKLPHKLALAELLAGDAALLLQAPNDTIHIPGKLFEAMGARVPVLALANPCEVTDIIQRCRAGLVSQYDDDAVAARLADFYNFHLTGNRWAFNETEVAKFSADAVVSNLAKLFEDAIVANRSCVDPRK